MDNHLVSLFIASTLLFVLIVSLLIFLAVNLRNQKNQFYLEKQQLLIANLEEGERVTNQIAREIHDNISQLNYLLHMTLRRMETTSGIMEHKRLLESAKDISSQIIDLTNNVGRSLNSDYIKEYGLNNLIDEDVKRIKEIAKMTCHVDRAGIVTLFDPDKELIIYRIVQEAIHNIMKHAKASVLSLNLQYLPDKFTLEIKDNGIGFDEEAIHKNGGIGLTNMRERAKFINGKLSITTRPGEGCAIVLSIDIIAA